MKRLLLILSLVLLLALAACGGETPQTAVPTGAAQTVEAVTLPAEGVPADATPTAAAEVPLEGAETGATSLTGVAWEWVSVLDPLGQTVVADPTRYTITFNDDGTANITADCNSVLATYTSDGSSLNIVLGPSTLVACAADSQDQLFVNSLPRAGSYTIQDGELFIEMLSDGGTIMFRQAAGAAGGEAPEGAGTSPTLLETWQWVETTTPAETIAVADPTRYTITFDQNGEAGLVADCNVGGATYTTGEGGAIDITLGVSTLAFCEDSQDQQFRAGLEAATTFTFEETFLVLGLPDGGAMRLQPAAATGGEGGLEAAPALTGATWQWVQTVTPETTVVATDPARYTITFNDDGTAAIQADCNSVTATYTASEADSTLTITPGASTLMACPEDSQATDFLNGLSAAAVYFFQDGDLYIDMFASSGTMQFTTDAGALEGAPAEPVLTGATWQWTDVMSANTATAVADPTRYTITFNEDGTAAIQADCNSVSATYTAADGAMTVTLGASTLAACPPDSQDAEFTAGLGAVTGYAFQDGNLALTLADGSTMLFGTAMTEDAAASGEAGGGAAGTTEGGAGDAGAADTGEKGAGLTGATWTWTALHTPASSTSVNDPSRFTLTFNADGTAHIQADCNQVRATYTVGEGNLLTVTPGASTMAYCGPGSLDQIFLGGLTNALGYRLEGGELIIDMLYESGSLVFAAAQ